LYFVLAQKGMTKWAEGVRKIGGRGWEQGQKQRTKRDGDNSRREKDIIGWNQPDCYKGSGNPIALRKRAGKRRLTGHGGKGETELNEEVATRGVR